MYSVIVTDYSAHVFRDGREVAQAVPTSRGVYHAVNVDGSWVAHEHESGITLAAWASRFTA